MDPLDGAGLQAETLGMDGDARSHRIRVIDQLEARFPGVARTHIEGIVDEEYETLNQGRIRNYIPILAERSAAQRLRLETQPGHKAVNEPLLLRDRPSQQA